MATRRGRTRAGGRPRPARDASSSRSPGATTTSTTTSSRSRASTTRPSRSSSASPTPSDPALRGRAAVSRASPEARRPPRRHRPAGRDQPEGRAARRARARRDGRGVRHLGLERPRAADVPLVARRRAGGRAGRDGHQPLRRHRRANASARRSRTCSFARRPRPGSPRWTPSAAGRSRWASRWPCGVATWPCSAAFDPSGTCSRRTTSSAGASWPRASRRARRSRSSRTGTSACSVARTIERHTRWAKMRRSLNPAAFVAEPILTPIVVASVGRRRWRRAS